MHEDRRESFAKKRQPLELPAHRGAGRQAQPVLQRRRIDPAEIDGHLRVAVKDEGNGEWADAHNEGSRMGLRLLQERLAALYGDDATLTLRSIDGGTSADLEFPARRVAEEER